MNLSCIFDSHHITRLYITDVMSANWFKQVDNDEKMATNFQTNFHLFYDFGKVPHYYSRQGGLSTTNNVTLFSTRKCVKFKTSFDTSQDFHYTSLCTWAGKRKKVNLSTCQFLKVMSFNITCRRIVQKVKS